MVVGRTSLPTGADHKYSLDPFKIVVEVQFRSSSPIKPAEPLASELQKQWYTNVSLKGGLSNAYELVLTKCCPMFQEVHGKRSSPRHDSQVILFRYHEPPQAFSSVSILAIYLSTMALSEFPPLSGLYLQTLL